ncbi:MAG: peptidoglycan editing factor PgeF [Candidatus Firestonebacteria bacterium]
MKTKQKNPFLLKTSNQIRYFTIPSWYKFNVSAFISTKPYDLSFKGIADKSATTIKNRKLIADAMGFGIDKLVTCQQTHSNKVAVIRKKDVGKGNLKYSTAIADTDGLITNLKNIPIAISIADCLPIFLVDPVNKSIGIVHAGWRGTFKKIAEIAILKMKTVFNSSPENLKVALGPSIGSCCYEIDLKLTDKFLKAFKKNSYENPFNWTKIFKKSAILDIKELNRRQLIKVGVLPENILVNPDCTKCNSDLFFSYRRDKNNAGRMMAVIWQT